MKNIKIKNWEVRSILELLNDKESLLNSDSPDKRLPLKIMWILDENYRKLIDISNKISEMEQKIWKRYFDEGKLNSEKDENGNEKLLPKDEYKQSLSSEINELMLIDNELSIATVPLSEFEKYELSGKDFQSIRFMIESKDVNKLCQD